MIDDWTGEGFDAPDEPLKTTEPQRITREHFNRELGYVDPPNELTMLERKFLFLYTQGVPPVSAYQQTFPKNLDIRERREHIRQILDAPPTKAYLERLHKHLEDCGVMSKLQVQMFLTAAATTPPSQIDADHPLCKRSIIIETLPDGTERKIVQEKLDPLKALEMLNRMNGWDAPQKIDMTHSGGVVHIPLAESVDEWGRIAEKQQKELTDGS